MTTEKLPLVSVVVPVYCAENYLKDCLASIQRQSYSNLEIIVVDDLSLDSSVQVIKSVSKGDQRVKPMFLTENLGTLGARKAGVLSSTGDYVLLVDQDDELLPQAIDDLVRYARHNVADIYHFPARVAPEGDCAAAAAAGMEAFLTPPVRKVSGSDILTVQLAEENGFDWHVHHKMYQGPFLRQCYGKATDERLILSDDIYMCFIICSLARSYDAFPTDPLYVYHLGRGDTYGSMLDLDGFDRLARAEASALSHAKAYVKTAKSPNREDWDERLADLRDRLVFHTMNEMVDSLQPILRREACGLALRYYCSDAVCGELYRFVRDRAYAYLMLEDKDSDEAKRQAEDALFFFELAKQAEKYPNFNSENRRYIQMKAIAMNHLVDSGLLTKAPRFKVLSSCKKLARRALGRFVR